MANTLEYKGSIGPVEYSREDRVFFGKIEMIDDLVTFESDSAKELEKVFQERVDDYLLTCEELGRESQKSYKGVFNIRIDPELHKKLYQEALKAGVSLNSYIQKALVSQVMAHEG